MYLNIINNIKYENKRKYKKSNYSNTEINSQEYKEEIEYINENNINTYYSIFYGDLTKNWIKLKP